MPRKAGGRDSARKPRGPSPNEIRAGWARAGDVDSLWDLLVNSPWDAIDQEDVFRWLVQALEVRSQDPERFAAEMFQKTTVLVSSLLLRSHLHLARCVAQNGRAVRIRAQPPGDLPPVAVEALIPRVVQLQEHLASLFAAEASVARQWALIRKSRARGDRAAADRPRQADGQGGARLAPDGTATVPANGHADHRLAGLLGGLGLGTNGVHHDE